MKSIAQVALDTGLTPRMIRHYERIGLIPAPSRSDGRYRLYSDDDVGLMHFIADARLAGFEVEDIRAMLADMGSGVDAAAVWIAAIERRRSAIDRILGKLTG